jgi:hypothetical protein
MTRTVGKNPIMQYLRRGNSWACRRKLDITHQMIAQDMLRKEKIHYQYRVLGQEHADAGGGNQFIPVTTSTSQHSSSMKVLMKFAVVVQGLHERFVDRNGMALLGVIMLHMSPSRIPNSEDDKFDEYGLSEMKELWKEWDEDVEGSGQLHRAILSNDLGVGALLLA